VRREGGGTQKKIKKRKGTGGVPTGKKSKREGSLFERGRQDNGRGQERWGKSRSV